MKYFIDKLFSEGAGIFILIFTLIFGMGFLLYQDQQASSEQDAREDAQVVELVKHGVNLPEARCAVKGC